MILELIAAAKPAGGAAIDQVVIATAGATLVTAVLLWLCAGHRSGKVPWLGRAAERASRLGGLPGWAALPTGVAGVSLMIALLGMYWDISLHIDLGRDEGPLANPAHYLILVGLYGVFAAGVLALSLPRPGERPGPAAIQIQRDWHAPVGGVLIAACGAFSLIAFPLDDMWHRIFGQDVTLWGPTHLMLIGGAGMTLVGQAILISEGMRARSLAGEDPNPRGETVTLIRRIALMGGFLIGLSTFQGEFDFGVPQFRAALHPFLVALAAAIALSAARAWIGRGGAIGAALFFLLVRGIIALLVGPVFGETTPVLPLYLGSAIAVELVAILLAPRAKPVAFGLGAGLAVATVGFATEWGWTHLLFDLPWTSDILVEGFVLSLAVALVGGVLGALLGAGLHGELPRPAVARGACAAAAVVVGLCLADGLLATVPEGERVRMAVTEASPGPDRTVNVEARFDPAAIDGDPSWVTMTAWQGGGLVVDRMERVREGVYRTTEPVPVHGDWKALVRLHDGRDLTAAPVFLPEDPAIPAKEVPAAASLNRPLQPEKEILQRELKDDVAGWLWPAACLLVLALYLAFLGALAWGVGRVSRRWGDDSGPQAPAPPRESRAAGTGAPVRPGTVPA